MSSEKLTENQIKEYYEDSEKYLLKPWRTRSPEKEPIILGGKGARFYDAQGKEYLDFLSQLYNVNLGIQNKKMVEAVKEQVEIINYTKNTYLNIPKIQLSKRLAELVGGPLQRTFFSNSGTEANEAAFKISRLYTGRSRIIAFWNAYHGSTYASMTAGGVAANRNPYEPLVPGFYHVPTPHCYRCVFGLEFPSCGMRCAEFLGETIKFLGKDSVAAFIADPVVVGAGVIIPPDGYWQRVREICTENDVLLIMDEVIAGCGRTGKLFAHQHWGFYPDILVLAKGISNAIVPLGVTMINEKISDYFYEKKSFPHGFTYSGHALACAAGLAALNTYVEEDIPGNAARVGEYLLDSLKGIKDRHESLGDIRALGLIAAMEFVKDRETKEPMAAEDPEAPPEERPMVMLSDYCLEDGLLVMPAMSGSVLRMAPPLIINKEDVDQATEILEKNIAKIEKKFL
jgi:4-aminobutyrate aminotransferase-like enzyme